MWLKSLDCSGVRGTATYKTIHSKKAVGYAPGENTDLAEEAGVSGETVKAFEIGRTEPIPVTLAALQPALEEGRVIFIDENGGGAGVRLRKEG